MKLLQTPLKVPSFEKCCPLNKKEPAEGLFKLHFWQEIKFLVDYMERHFYLGEQLKSQK